MTRGGSRFGRSAGCREVLGLVTDYLDGALPAGRRRRLEAHLTGCADCLAYLEQIRVTIGILGCLRTGEVPQGLLSRLCGIFPGSGAPQVPEGRQ
ncbi:anti-sigma factor family protein [Streptosporangium sp. NPDC004631]